MQKMLKTSAEGRKCRFPHCTRILSIYNHEDYCHIHRDIGPKGEQSKLSAYLEELSKIR
jgi:hypothetical protein